MDTNEASQSRFVRIIDPLDSTHMVRYYGKEVHSVNERGVIIALKSKRLYYPWRYVYYVEYHTDDVDVRNFLSGY